MDINRALNRAIDELEQCFERLQSEEDKRRFLIAIDEWVVNVQANNLPGDG
jgi:hypothetical protein